MKCNFETYRLHWCKNYFVININIIIVVLNSCVLLRHPVVKLNWNYVIFYKSVEQYSTYSVTLKCWKNNTDVFRKLQNVWQHTMATIQYHHTFGIWRNRILTYLWSKSSSRDSTSPSDAWICSCMRGVPRHNTLLAPARFKFSTITWEQEMRM